MKIARNRWPWVLSAITLAALAATPIYLSSCTPGSEITAAESDVVVTLFDANENFGALTTYAVSDSIIHLCGTDSLPGNCPSIDRTFDAQIIARIKTNLDSRGYTEEPNPNTNPPSFVLFVGVAQSDFYNVSGGCGGWYYPPGWGNWGYPGGCWGYPPALTPIYSFSTGTLFMVMIDPLKDDGDEGTVPVVWNGSLNGVITGSGSTRVLNGIDQAFEQSPYLVHSD